MTGRRAIVAVVAVLLTAAQGCGDVTIDVGPAAPNDPCHFWGSTTSAGCTTTVTGQLSYRQDGVQKSPASVDASVIGPVVTMSGSFDAAIAITVWAQGPGTYRCEDPATAGRTYVTIRATQWQDTTSGGRCEITITRFPTPEDTRFEGTFSVTFNASKFGPASKVEDGTFSLSGVERF